MWDKQAEFCSKYFQKGRQVAVVGRIQTRTWDDSEGKRHYVTEVVAEETYFADSKRGDDAGRNTVSAGMENTGLSDGFYTIEDDDQLPF